VSRTTTGLITRIQVAKDKMMKFDGRIPKAVWMNVTTYNLLLREIELLTGKRVKEIKFIAGLRVRVSPCLEDIVVIVGNEWQDGREYQ